MKSHWILVIFSKRTFFHVRSFWMIMNHFFIIQDLVLNLGVALAMRSRSQPKARDRVWAPPSSHFLCCLNLLQRRLQSFLNSPRACNDFFDKSSLLIRSIYFDVFFFQNFLQQSRRPNYFSNIIVLNQIENVLLPRLRLFSFLILEFYSLRFFSVD